MRLNFFLFLITFFISLSACVHQQKVTEQAFGVDPTSEMVDRAFDMFVNQISVDAVIDTTLGPIGCNLYTDPCTIELNTEDIGDGWFKRGIKYYTKSDCTEVRDSLQLGYVYLPVTDPNTKRLIWVPCQALLRSNIPKGNERTFKIHNIYTGKNGEGMDKILVQVE